MFVYWVLRKVQPDERPTTSGSSAGVRVNVTKRAVFSTMASAGGGLDHLRVRPSRKSGQDLRGAGQFCRGSFEGSGIGLSVHRGDGDTMSVNALDTGYRVPPAAMPHGSHVRFRSFPFPVELSVRLTPAFVGR